MIPLQVASALLSRRHGGNKHVVTMAIFRKLLIPVVVVMVIMLAIFLPTGVEETEHVVMSAGVSAPTIQSAAAVRYITAVTRRDSNDGGRTTVDTSKAYVDAEGLVPTYHSGLVQNKNGLTLGVNTPTRSYEKAAYVVNVSNLLEAEIQDIITFEQNTLGISGHKSAKEYAIEQLAVKNTILLNGARAPGGREMWTGAVGPAVVIRNYYQDHLYEAYLNHKIGFWDCFGGDYDNAFFDAMLVETKDVEAYLAGKDVNVTYIQFRSFFGDAKAHAAPWGITQTYFQGNAGNTMTPNTSAGKFTPVTLGTVPITGDAPKDMKALLNLARTYNDPVYYWPTILATKQTLGIGTLVSTPTFPTATLSILESWVNNASKTVANEYAGYSLVGILVYATQ